MARNKANYKRDVPADSRAAIQEYKESLLGRDVVAYLVTPGEDEADEQVFSGTLIAWDGDELLIDFEDNNSLYNRSSFDYIELAPEGNGK